MRMRMLGSLLVTTLISSLAAAPRAGAATPAEYVDHGTYSIDGGLTNYQGCSEANKIGTPWSYQGASNDIDVDRSVAYDAVQTSTNKVAARYAAQGTLTSTLSHGRDGSLVGRLRFNGLVSVQTVLSGVCSGYGQIKGEYDKVLRAEHDGVFTITGTAPAQEIQSTNLSITTANPDSAGLPDTEHSTTVYEMSASGSDANGHPRPLSFATSFTVKAGQYVGLDGSTNIVAGTQEGGGEMTWDYRLIPAGEQLAPTPAKAAHVVRLPTHLDCRHHRFVFKPRKASTIRKVTVSVDGKRLRTIRPVHRRVKVKLKPTAHTITLAFVYRSGKKRTVSKSYAACR